MERRDLSDAFPMLDQMLARAPEPAAPAAGFPDETARRRVGEALLATAWAALAARRIDAIDIHLRSGLVIAGALAVRIDGAIGEAATRHGAWTHGFALADVSMIRQVPRGGLAPGD